MATLIACMVAFVFMVCSIGLLVAFFNARVKLARYSQIDDVESHKQRIQEQANELQLNCKSYATELAKSKQMYAKYSEVLGAYKSAAEVKAKVDQLKADAERAKQDIELYRSLLGEAQTMAECQERISALKNELAGWQRELALVQDEHAMQDVGIYKRHFAFDSVEKFRQEIQRCVEDQKSLVRTEKACSSSITWVVEGSEAKGRKMMQEQVKLMLRAFNGECDAAIAKVKHSNYLATQKRIRRAFDTLNKLGSTKQVAISQAYLDSRLRELRLNHELELQKEEEKQRQRDIKEQMADEAKAEREIAEATTKALRDEEIKAKALEEARQQLLSEHGKHNEKLEELVAKLELELKEAIDRKAKAIARAQLTRSGHVYVLSNIGTMGHGVYKIGMTRRFEPLERVAELGDASVPFPFDVHAMIYSEDAPSLEATLHRHFEDRRVNLVNLRKEYFNVSLDEIMQAVEQHFGKVTFIVEPNAEQYYESEAIRADRDVAVA